MRISVIFVSTIILIIIGIDSISESKYTVCNQTIYDELYYEVQRANLNLEVQKLHRMNEHYQYDIDYEEEPKLDFSIFRALCRGQVSTYERGLNVKTN